MAAPTPSNVRLAVLEYVVTSLTVPYAGLCSAACANRRAMAVEASTTHARAT